MTAQTKLELESSRLAELEASLESEARKLVARESDLDDRSAPAAASPSFDQHEAREVLEQLRAQGERRDLEQGDEDEGEAPESPGGHWPWPAPAAG